GRRIYDYILVPVFGANGQVEAVAGTTRDVTDRRQAEEDVRSRTAQFETLLNQAPLGVYLIDDQFRISHVNPSARPVFGDIPDLIGRDFDEVLHILWHATYADELVRVFRHTLQTGEPHTSAERREERLDLGRTEYYEWRTDRIILPNGAFGVVCYFQDISAQVKARERIAESEERFRTLVSVITEVPWVADPSGMFVTPQSAWEHYTGQAWEQHRDLGWANAVHPEDRVRFLQRWQHACESATLFECEGRLWHADSSQWRYFAARATPVLTDRSKVREWVGACTDVDVQKRTESALRLARDEAEKSSRAKDHFMAVLSHELRTPLTPVLMAVASLEHDPQLPPDAREELSMVRRNIELETKLIDDLLDLSRITAGKLALKLETVDLHEAILRVCGICKPQAREQGVKLSFEPCSIPIHLQADAARLQQVLWNVVRNAIKFTPEDGRVDITTSVLSGGRCEVRVLDNGVGIPAAALPHIFDAFEQGGTAVTRQFGGMGLGLAISASLVALHGGAIRAESPGEGQGSTFVIELQCHALTSGPSAVSSISPISAASPRQGTLLLVEDNEDTLRTLARMLRKSGFEVLTASSVAEGVAAVSKGGFDLLVSDLGLPDGQGYEVMRHLADTSTAPGIAMSGYGMEEDMRLSREAGFSEHLVKPVDFRQLLAAVERALPKAGMAEKSNTP
ncbi:MAG TPA: ATP-binding protein, partial [Verrucomicrobium sp.]|nr:ATP-binding protein [Verrucomicrobium sp.]